MNRKPKILTALLGCMAIIGITSSCSSEFDSAQTDNGQQTDNTSCITFSIKAPGAGDVLVRSTSQPEWQETWERSFSEVNVYIFTAANQGADDSGYTLAKAEKMKVGTGINDLIVSNDTYTGTIRYGAEYNNKYVKLAILANKEAGVTCTVGTTTLADLKNATATLTAEDGLGKCDDIVGLKVDPATSEKTGEYPMSGISDEAQLKSGTTELEVALTRIMARVDIYNTSSNVTITDVKVSNAVNGGYLFDNNTDGTPVVPESLSSINLAPIQSYFDDHFSTVDGKKSCPYTFVTGDLTPGSEAYELERRNKNCFTAIYLYEQKVTDDDSSPVITISYDLSVGKDNNGNVVTVSGEIPVRFYGKTYTTDDQGNSTLSKDDGFMNVLRNHLYRIRLGEGQNEVKAFVEPVDWTIDEDINVNIDKSQEGE